MTFNITYFVMVTKFISSFSTVHFLRAHYAYGIITSIQIYARKKGPNKYSNSLNLPGFTYLYRCLQIIVYNYPVLSNLLNVIS